MAAQVGVCIDDVTLFDVRQDGAAPLDMKFASGLMKANGIYRGLLDDSYLSLPPRPSRDAVSSALALLRSRCIERRAFLVINQIAPLLENPNSIGFLIELGMPFFALDRVGLGRGALISRTREAGTPLDAAQIDIAISEARMVAGEARLVEREARRDPGKRWLSEKIKAGMRSAARGGVKLGNPELHKAREKALEVHQLRKPSVETVDLIAGLRSDGHSLRSIADRLNESGVPTPQGRRWYASGVRNYLNRITPKMASQSETP